MELEQLKQQVGEIIFFLQGRNFLYRGEKIRKSEIQDDGVARFEDRAYK